MIRGLAIGPDPVCGVSRRRMPLEFAIDVDDCRLDGNAGVGTRLALVSLSKAPSGFHARSRWNLAANRN